MTSKNNGAVATLILVNLALFAFVSANATCPTLDVCAKLPIVNVAIGSQVSHECCPLIYGLVDAKVELCLCSILKQSGLGSAIATTLGLTSGLPIVGGLIGGLLSPVIYTLNYSVLNSEVLALVNACGYNPDNYKCAYY